MSTSTPNSPLPPPSPDEPLQRLTKDLKAASTLLSRAEARYLVDVYYNIQGLRIESDQRSEALDDAGEPNLVIGWFGQNAGRLERQIARALDAYSAASPTGQWARSIHGIGPVIAAGLQAHIDITRSPTVGKIWRFAGLDPTDPWEKGQKRPWNAALKVLCWKIGESFVKQSHHEKDFYGRLYLERKAKEAALNQAGAYREQAAKSRTRLKRADSITAKANEAGRLSDGHIHARARRWAVKLFLAHYHAVAYQYETGQPAPKPYILTQPPHSREIQCPNWPF